MACKTGTVRLTNQLSPTRWSNLRTRIGSIILPGKYLWWLLGAVLPKVPAGVFFISFDPPYLIRVHVRNMISTGCLRLTHPPGRACHGLPPQGAGSLGKCACICREKNSRHEVQISIPLRHLSGQWCASFSALTHVVGLLSAKASLRCVKRDPVPFRLLFRSCVASCRIEPVRGERHRSTPTTCRTH